MESLRRKEPLYLTLRREFLSKIERGVWAVGHKMPGEDELIKEYGYSRGTIRQALQELESAGYIRRMAGKGTFVLGVSSRVNKSLTTLSSFTQMVSQSGLHPSTKVLEKGMISATTAENVVREQLGLLPDSLLVSIKRIRQGNGEALALQTVFVPAHLVPGMLDEALDTSLLALYETRYGHRLTRAEERLSISQATGAEADILAIPVSTPLVYRSRLSFDQEGQPFEYLSSIDLASRFHYHYSVIQDAIHVHLAPEGTKEHR